jgi:hypothetical protein
MRTRVLRRPIVFLRVRCSIPHCTCMGRWWSDTGRKTELLGEKSVLAATLRPDKKLCMGFRTTVPLVLRWQTVRRSNPADSRLSSHRHEQLLCLYGLLINRLHDRWCNWVSVCVVAFSIYGLFRIPNNILVRSNGCQHGNWYNFAIFLYQQWAVPKNIVIGWRKGGCCCRRSG